MDYKLVLKPRAENDLANGIEWYESKQKGLSIKFLKCVEKYLERIHKNPLHYPLKKNQYREAFIEKFPYMIIYEVLENEVVVFSVFNTDQNPEKKILSE
ncbi:MAG: type II toxin-antitoxin system RelE/ParE family toxin [Bacteroidetes bacterium]|jgi:plasmid stabilization system protein ParE|nr:type II toxin-antitoxin system RelE/ParE family toxin [Bacteroidota bacterium]